MDMKNKNLKLTDEIKEGNAILSGYVRYRTNNKTYYLNINSRLLGKYLMGLKNKIKVKVLRDNKRFIINVNRNGNVLRGDRRGPLTCISKDFLNLKEQEQLKSQFTKYSLSCKVDIKPEEFGIKKYDLYPDQDAAKLACSLEEKGFEIPERIMTPYSFNHDLVFNYRNKQILIEITRSKPSKVNDRNFKHQGIGSNIWAHVFDVYRDCATDKLNKNNKKIGFVVISENWKTYNHIQSSKQELKLVNCYYIFTDFSKTDWFDDVSAQIQNKLKEVT